MLSLLLANYVGRPREDYRPNRLLSQLLSKYVKPHRFCLDSVCLQSEAGITFKKH